MVGLPNIWCFLGTGRFLFHRQGPFVTIQTLTSSLTCTYLLVLMATFDQTYNVNKELCACLELVYEILDGLDNIKVVLWKRKELTEILSPQFDPFKTIGKYCWQCLALHRSPLDLQLMINDSPPPLLSCLFFRQSSRTLSLGLICLPYWQPPLTTTKWRRWHYATITSLQKLSKNWKKKSNDRLSNSKAF